MVDPFVGTGVVESILASKFITPLWTTTGKRVTAISWFSTISLDIPAITGIEWRELLLNLVEQWCEDPPCLINGEQERNVKERGGRDGERREHRVNK